MPDTQPCTHAIRHVHTQVCMSCGQALGKCQSEFGPCEKHCGACKDPKPEEQVMESWDAWRENLCKVLGVANMLDATRRLAQLANGAAHRQRAEDYYQDAWEKQDSYRKALQRLETNGQSEEARLIRSFVASLAYSHNEAMLAAAVAPTNPIQP